MVLLIAASTTAEAQAQGTPLPFVRIQFFTNTGAVCSGCLLNVYNAGTSTRVDTYYVVGLTAGSENANPVVMDSAGRPSTGYIYLSPSSYRFVLTDSTGGTTYWDQDNTPSIPATAVGLDLTSQTAGEALVLGDFVYLSDGSGGQTAGRWYKADADFTYASSTAGRIGVATATIASAGTGTIRIGGRMTGLTGLTAGEYYYISATAGAITGTPPTNAWFVGKADTTTSLIVGPGEGAVRFPDSDGTHSAVQRITQNLTADRLWSVTFGDAALTTNFTPGTAGMLLRSDGTNWAASTTIFPNSATTGDLLYASAANTYANRAAVAVGSVLISAGVGTAPTWGAVACGALPAGAVCQTVAATYAVETGSSSSSYTDTGLTVTITPSSASNKVLVTATINGCGHDSTAVTGIGTRLLRDAVQIAYAGAGGVGNEPASTNHYGTCAAWSIFDAPATTSATVYKVTWANLTNAGNAYIQLGSRTSTIVVQEIKQ